MFGNSPPQAPNYTAAAQEQYRTGRDVNRPNIFTPWGSMMWDPGRQNMQVQLSPEDQAQLETQRRIRGQRSSLAESLLGGLDTGPLDLSNLPGLPSVDEARKRGFGAVYEGMTSRLDPAWAQRSTEDEAQLLARGLSPGTEAYDRERARFSQSRNDAYDQAMRAATTMGETAAQGEFGRGLAGRQQALSEMLKQRGWPLAQIQELLGGVDQVGMPQFPSFSQAQGPNLLGAAQAQYSGDLDQYSIQQALLQSILGGMGGLGGSLLGSFAL